MAPQRKKPKQQQRNAATNSRAAGPAIRTRAASRQEQQQQQLGSAELVLPLLLQHDSIRTQLPLVCKLLCCSKAVAAAVAEHCAGQLDMPQFEQMEEAQQAAPWLRKHARLARSLDLQTCDEHLLLQEGQVEETSGNCVAALMAAGPQTLALQSLKAYGTPTTLALLEQLPASRLTHLDWSVDEELLQPAERPAFVARVSAALGRLTALRSLGLSRDVIEGPQQELSGLTQLTSLCFQGPVADLQHVPPQLLALDISDAWRQPGQALELQRLAALTALTSVVVQQGDALPPNLLRLHVHECRSAQPLLGLQQLQQLHLWFDGGGPADISAGQLHQLSRLTSLSLCYCDTAEPASAAAWPVLPLQRLELYQASLSVPLCQCLAQLTGLSSLQLLACQLPQPGLAQQLAATLPQLSGLQQLKLAQPQLAAGENTTAEPSQGVQQLVQAVGSLQRLRELDIRSSPQLATAAAAVSDSFTGLSAVTALSLASCDPPDAAVSAIVAQLPGLQSLDCSSCPRITNAALFTIGQLQQLACLRLDWTGVSDACLQLCTGLTRLRELSLHATDVTDAGVCHLTRLGWLQELRVPKRVSQQRRRWLQQHLPDLVKLQTW